MNEMTMQEIDEVSGGVPVAVAAVGVALGTAAFGALAAGAAAGYTMMNDYLYKRNK